MKRLNSSEVRMHNHIEAANSIGNKKCLLFYMTKFYEIIE